MSLVDPLALVRKMAEAALNAQAELAKDRTEERVPRDENDLAESLFVDEASTTDLRARLGTDSEYAIYQHEALGWRHDDGEAKFMEKAVTGGESVRAMAQAALRAARRVAG